MNAGRRIGGFTLKELVAVLVLIGLAVAVMLPMIDRRGGTPSRANTCRNNMKNLALATYCYENSHNHYPGFRDSVSDGNGRRFSRPLLYMITPQIERMDIYERYGAVGHPYDGMPGMHLELLICPSAAGDDNSTGQSGAASNYIFNTGMPDVPSAYAPPDWPANGVIHNRYLTTVLEIAFPDNNSRFISAGDGMTNTLLLSERRGFHGWTDTAEYDVGFVWHPRYEKEKLAQINSRPQNPYAASKYMLARPSSNHPQLVNVAFCDGHVRSIDQGIGYRVYAGLMTPGGGQAAHPGLRKGKRRPVPEAFRRQPLDDEY